MWTDDGLDGLGFFEAKAILLGRMGRHENALEIYVYRLHDYLKAEEYASLPYLLPPELNLPAYRYCNRVFDLSSSKTSSIFLTLLRIYLQPGVSSTAKSPTTSAFSLPPPATLLQPALQLISRHSRRLDATETLKLLPPLVQARDVKEFLIESLRMPRFDTRVIRGIAKAGRDDVATRLMVLEEKRVKVVDSRMYVFHFLSLFIFLQPSSARTPFGPEGVLWPLWHFLPSGCRFLDPPTLLIFASVLP